MLKKRILTALVGIPVAIAIISYGKWLFAVAILALTLIAWHEYTSMFRNKAINIAYIPGLIGVSMLWGCAWLGNNQEMVFVLLFVGVLVFAKTVFSCNTFSISDAAFTITGIFYVGLTFCHLILLRFASSSSLPITLSGDYNVGATFLWIAFIGTWASDTFAYFVGSKYGRTKLCPDISPGKTIEGAFGGLLGCIITVIIVGEVFKIALGHSLMIGILIGIVAPIGDLIESAFKRFTSVKDSGKLLPGHGGILDRFDSVMLAAPTVYYYLYAFVL